MPKGILLLLRLAAAESDAEREAQKINKRAPDDNRAAAIFFIEQVLLASDSDAYRTLGLDRTASAPQRRRHMAYLLKWLHPDLGSDPHKARLARRVLSAWNEIKTASGSLNGNDGVPERAEDISSLPGRARHPRKTRPYGPLQERRARYTDWFKKQFKMRAWPL